ncbi:MAG: hypothetical protein KKA79_07490 [Nanoarchaeota archaeon]|nr:hypothetical protein [Nanoarchaeota archaeon]
MILPLKVLWNEKGLYWQILRYLLLSFFLLAIFVTYNSGKAALLSDFTQAEGMMVIAVKHISPPYYSAKMDANLIINPILDLVHRGEEDYYRAGESTYGILLQIENSPMEWKTRHLRLNKFNKSLVEARFQEFLDKKIIVNYFNNLTNDLIFVKSIGGCYIYNEQDPTYTNPNVNYCK